MAAGIENPYGIEALWQQGDWVARVTLLVLVAMSIASWYVTIMKLVDQARLFRDAREAERLWNAPTVAQGMAALASASAFRYMAEEGQRARQHHAAMRRADLDLDRWLAMSLDLAIQAIGGRLQGGLALLATVGATAPFVGLFGTVWGIYHALTAIGIAGQASIDKVAGPVGEALIMTALGLAVAVPAVLAYNWLVRRNRVAMDMVRRFAAGVQMSLLADGHAARPAHPHG